MNKTTPLSDKISELKFETYEFGLSHKELYERLDIIFSSSINAFLKDLEKRQEERLRAYCSMASYSQEQYEELLTIGFDFDEQIEIAKEHFGSIIPEDLK
jgi:hypothetical protein